MSDIHSELVGQLNKGRRVIFTKVDRPLNRHVCVVEDAATGRHIATSEGGNPYTALFDASAIESWTAILKGLDGGANAIRRDQQKLREDAAELRAKHHSELTCPAWLTCPACERPFCVGQETSTFTMGGIQTTLHASCLDRLQAAGIPLTGNPRRGTVIGLTDSPAE